MIVPILFDFDDTIIESRDSRGSLLLDSMSSFGLPVNATVLEKNWGLPFNKLFAELAETSADQFENFVEYYCDVLRRNKPSANMGVIETIVTLTRGHPLFVVTSSLSVLVRTDLASLGILEAFELVCGCDMQLESKPSAKCVAPIEFILNQKSLTISGGVLVGDSPSDFALAKNLHSAFLGAAFTPRAKSRLLDAGVPKEQIISDMQEILGRVAQDVQKQQ